MAVRRHEWVVPCYGEGPWDGAAYVEVAKAIAAATQHAEAAGITVADDTIMVRPGDETVIVYYVEEQKLPGERPVGGMVATALRAMEAELADLVGDSTTPLPTSVLARVEQLLVQTQRLIRGF